MLKNFRYIMMSKRNLVLAVLLLLGWMNSEGQHGDEMTGAGGHFRILTDRTVYIASESICFSVYSTSKTEFSTLDWSKVIYVELISPQGNSMAFSKTRLSDEGSIGHLEIPVNIASGTYFVRAYTRWMRNCGPASFSYITVQILNPFSESLLPVDTLVNEALDLHCFTGSKRSYFNILLNDNLLERREQAEVIIESHYASYAEFSVSVVREGSLGQQYQSEGICSFIPKTDARFFPETKGVSISGTVINPSTEEPVPFAIVYLTNLDKSRQFICNYADESGKFYFSLPESYGEKELFVSAFHKDHPATELRIDRDFTSEFVAMPSYPLSLSDSMLALYNDLSINAQIFQQYRNRVSETAGDDSRQQKFFYGRAHAVIEFDDFIKLPSMQEYFSELVPQVSIRKRDGMRYFMLMGNHHDLSIYDPLVMIDGVAIFDIEAVLNVSPGYISRIEIIEEPYVRGNVTFGGIINIISRNDDLGYVDLPSSGLLLNYKMFDEKEENTWQSPPENNMPDVRNTLYWNGKIRLESLARHSFSFQTSDVPGRYQVILRGFTDEGEYFMESKSFDVL